MTTNLSDWDDTFRHAIELGRRGGKTEMLKDEIRRGLYQERRDWLREHSGPEHWITVDATRTRYDCICGAGFLFTPPVGLPFELQGFGIAAPGDWMRLYATVQGYCREFGWRACFFGGSCE